MNMLHGSSGVQNAALASEHVWSELYTSLRPSVLSWVYTSGVSSWYGQERDVADDILQEAVLKTLKYSRLVADGQGTPIHSMTCFGRTVAQNHFRDVRRRELRLVHPVVQEGSELSIFDLAATVVDPAEVAMDELERASILLRLAHIIVDFPPKQRTALLIDLAKHDDFVQDQSPLRSTFLSVGIDLVVYRHISFADQQARSRHAASLSMAYKRLRQCFWDCYPHWLN